MDQVERIKRYGIECTGPSHDNGILFKAGHWRPGGEYIQKLRIKNVATVVKKLKYKLPKTRYFSMGYPEVIVLSPGMFKDIDVVFRPVEHEPYDDTIYIKMQDGIEGNGFHVPVRAMIDKLILSAPDGIDFGFCPAFQTTTLTFKLVNDGEVDARFKWEVPVPFTFAPSEGVVAVGSFQVITITIFPTDAWVYVSKATCHVGTGVHALIPNPTIATKISAITKFTYIALSESEVKFDEVVSGSKPITRDIVLRNNSVVPSEFKLVRFDKDKDEVFFIEPKTGVIPPQGEIAINVTYIALAAGLYSLDRYAFRTPSNCDTILTCKGTSMPPKVTLFKELSPHARLGHKHDPLKTAQLTASAEFSAGAGSTLSISEGAPEFSLNFRDVEVGNVETRILVLQNESNRSVSYIIMADEHGIFQMSPKEGTIPPLTKSFAVKITFAPTLPMNYYRRYFVLVSDSLPLFYDCMGTGFIRAKGEIKEQRPAPIRHAHVQAFRNRSVQGLGVLAPDELDNMYDAVLKTTTAEMHRSNSAGLLLSKGSLMESSKYNVNNDFDFFAQVGRTGTRALSVALLQKPVTRTGETLRTLVAPAHEFFINDMDNENREVVVNKLYLDFGYAPTFNTSTPKTLVVTNNTRGKVVVQWQVPSVKGIPAPDPRNVSQNSIDKRIVVNDGTEEREYALQRAFLVEPMMIEINAGKSFTFQITFNPKFSNRNFLSELEALVYFKNQRTFRLVHDHSLTPPWCLAVTAFGHTFSSGQLLAKGLICGGNVRHGKLIFPTCYVNESTYQIFTIRNTSNLPSTFRIELGWGSDPLASTTQSNANSDPSDGFQIKPDVGEIAAEEFTLICVKFQPMRLSKYIQLLRCIINGDEGGKLILEGMGAVPFVILPDLIQPEVVSVYTERKEQIWGLPSRPVMNFPNGPQGDFFTKPTCVGLSTTRKLIIKNGSRLPIRFHIKIPQSAYGIININPLRGVLKGNEEIAAIISFAAREAVLYKYKITINTFPIGGRTFMRLSDANQPGPVMEPELLQSLSLNLIAPGEIGAVVFDPPNLLIDVRLVNSTELKDIFIENISDSDVAYQILYREHFVADSASRIAIHSISDILPLIPSKNKANPDGSLKHLTSPKDNKNISSTVSLHSLSSSSTDNQLVQNLRDIIMEPNDSKNEYNHSLFCEKPFGILAARSRNRIPIVFHPIKAGLFEFSIYASIRAIDRMSQQPVMITNDEAALLRISQKDRQKSTKSSKTDKELNRLVNELSALPLTASITARAAYPKLLFEDIRTDVDIQISDIEYLWQRFNFSSLNYDLSIPMTAQEMKLYHASTLDMNKIPVYNFEFSPAVINSPLQTIRIQVRNNGFLPTALHMHLPNEKNLDLEAWCDEEEPSIEHNRFIAIIEELKLFTIEPRHAYLEPGDVCTITVSYAHNSLKYNGQHNLPVLVKLSKGKQFYIDLIGRTLPNPQLNMGLNLGSKRRLNSGILSVVNSISSNAHPPGTPHSQRTKLESAGVSAEHSKWSTAFNAVQSSLQMPEILLLMCTGKDNKVKLSSVPIGLFSSDQTPKQRTELINVSGSSISYEVDLDALNTANENNYNLPIIAIANPAGMVPAGGSIFLEWYFYPLQAKDYEFELNIKYYATSNPTSLTFGMSHANPPNDRTSVVNKLPGSGGEGRSRGSALGNKSPGRSTYATSIVNAAANAVAQQTIPPQHLHYILTGKGYDPRYPKPMRPEDQYDGGMPPIQPILSMPNQYVKLIEDLLNFAVIPQLCTARRVLLMYNSSEACAVEYIVDEASCVLALDGLLMIRPTIGKIEPKQTVAIDFIFTATTKPMIFEERLKIMVREVMRNTASRRGGARQQMLDKIRAKKASIDHESVVTRATFSRSLQIEHVQFPEGVDRIAHYPSTVNEGGELIIGSTANLADSMQKILAASTTGTNILKIGSNAGVDDLDLEIIGDVASNTMEFDRKSRGNGSFAGGMSVNSQAMDRSVMSKSSRGNNNNPTGTNTYGFNEDTMTKATPMSRSSRESRSQGSRSGSEVNTLFGQVTTLIIRLKGEVYGVETVRNLTDRMEQPDEDGVAVVVSRKNSATSVVKEFILPKVTRFIPPNGTKVNEFDRAQPGNTRSKMNLSLVKSRWHELRAVSEYVCHDLFDDLLTTNHVWDGMRTTITGDNPQHIDKISIKAPGVSNPPTIMKTMKKPIYGVYFKEILPKQSLHSRLIAVLKALGFQNERVDPMDQMDPIQLESNLTTGITDAWKSSERELLLINQYSFSLSLRSIRQALFCLRIKPKDPMTSAVYKEIDSSACILAEKIDNDAASLVPSIGSLSIIDQYTREAAMMDTFPMEEDDDKYVVCVSQLVYSLPSVAQSMLKLMMSKLENQHTKIKKTSKQSSKTVKPSSKPTMDLADIRTSLVNSIESGASPSRRSSRRSRSNSENQKGVAILQWQPQKVRLEQMISEPLNALETSMRRDGFVEMVSEVLNDVMLGLVQDTANQ